MLGLPLIYEMALVATLACLISWLMGRTLCKSGEHEERAAKKAVQAANERLEALLLQKDSEIHQLSQRCQAEQQTLQALQQQHNTTENLLAKSQQEHQESLASMQELIAYRTQFEALTQVHEEQARQVIALQETIKQTQNEMAQAIALNAEQHEALETTNQQLYQAKQETDTLLEKQQKLENEAGNQDSLIAQLRKQIADLQAENETQRETIETLNTKINGYLQSVNSTNRRIAGMLDTLPGTR